MEKLLINSEAPDFSLADYSGKELLCPNTETKKVLLVFDRGLK